MNRKYLLPVVIIWVIVGCLFFYWKFKQPNIQPIIPDVPIFDDIPVLDDTVVFSTDKTEYEKGETIKMLIENNSAIPVSYFSEGGKFWELEYLLGETWISFDYNVGQGFELTNKNDGDTCYLVLYERSELKLDSRTTLSTEWNQKVCPYGNSGGPYVPKTVFNLQSRQYRFVFKYYPETQNPSSDTESSIVRETIYSNAFTIK